MALFGPFFSFWSQDFNLLSACGAQTSEESTSLLCESDYELFISEEACWSVWECKILRALHWDTKSCHWLAMTFSLMVMTFYLSQCACSCRWLWESVELSDSKVKKKEKETFHQIVFVISDNYRSFNNTYRLLSIQLSSSLFCPVAFGLEIN